MLQNDAKPGKPGRQDLLGKQALCQLSYSRSGVARVYERRPGGVNGSGGGRPATRASNRTVPPRPACRSRCWPGQALDGVMGQRATRCLRSGCRAGAVRAGTGNCGSFPVGGAVGRGGWFRAAARPLDRCPPVPRLRAGVSVRRRRVCSAAVATHNRQRAMNGGRRVRVLSGAVRHLQGEAVCGPFLGSGTCFIAAERQRNDPPVGCARMKKKRLAPVYRL